MGDVRDERRGEIVPSRITPEVRFFADDIEAIAYLSWEDADTTVCHQTDMSYPLRELQMFVLGSDKSFKDYGYQTEMLLREPEDQDIYESFFGTLQENLKAVELDHDPGTYVFRFPEGAWYTMSFEPITGRLEVCTAAGRSWSHPSLNALSALSLQHDSDNELDSLNEFVKLNEFIIEALYSFVGDKNTQLRLELGVIEQPHEETEDHESALQPAETPPEARKITLDDLAGIENIKDRLREAVLAIQHPEIMAKWGAERPSGVLLYGPPGTGKTTLAEAVANEVGAKLRVVKSNEIYGMYMGDSEKGFQAIIEEALKTESPLVLLFDELDGVISSSGGSAYAKVAALFKQEIGTLSQRNPNIVVIATSNKSPHEFDPALVRHGRLDLHIHVPMPDYEARRAIFGVYVDRHVLDSTDLQIFDLSDINFDELASRTEDMSGATIREIIRRLTSSKAITHITSGKVPEPIRNADIINQIERFKAGI